MRIYLDHAASTPILPEALEAMLPHLTNIYGNPSATHTEGRQAKASIEQARKNIASRLHCQPSEILFTSGGSEANTTAILGACKALGIQRIISTQIEHACVLNSILAAGCPLDFVQLDAAGAVDIAHLQTLLRANHDAGVGPQLVSIIHAHNELGTINDIAAISQICHQFGAYLHSDMVQSLGHLQLDMSKLPYLHFASASAHKFGGSKGAGFLFVNKKTPLSALIQGGGQERKLRGGTENTAAIVAMSTAFELAMQRQTENQTHIETLRTYFISQLIQALPSAYINGTTQPNSYLYSILSVALPYTKPLQTLLFQLDLAGIAASAGAACSSGALQASAVSEFLALPPSHKTIRFSFAASNTLAEIDKVISTLTKICA